MPWTDPRSHVFTARGRALTGGAWVRRLFPLESGPAVEPFLLLEQVGPMVFEAGRAGPSNPRPLNALEAGTYVLRGELEVAHSGGHRAILHAGDVQWATVGRQVTQTEVPGRRTREQGGPLSVLRVWVRLPKVLADAEARYQEYPAATIPDLKWNGGEASVRVVVGDALGTRGPVESASPVNFQVWSLPQGSEATFSLPASQRGLAYVLEGTAGVGSPPIEVPEGGLILLAAREPVHLHGYVSPESLCRVLVLAGEPASKG